MGDDGAAHGGVVADDLVQGLGHTEQNGRRHVGAADVGDLDAGDVGNVEHLWNGVHELLDADRASLVACRGGVVRAGAGDGAAGCQDGDIRERRVHLGEVQAMGVGEDVCTV